jgi:TP901 family phage tail tape measure protein
MDVSLKLRLDYKDRGARRAKKDLQELDKVADRLDGAGATKLGRDLDKVGSNARRAATALELPASKVRALDALKTDRVEGELNSLKRAAEKAGTSLERPAKELRALNRLSTDRVEKEIKDLGKAADRAGDKLKDLDKTKFTRFNDEINKTSDKIDQLGKKVTKQNALVTPTKNLNGAIGALGVTAGNAFGALLAFASVDNIVRGLNQLETGFNSVDDAAARVAVTAEMRDPKVVAAIKAENDRVAMRYGLEAQEVNAARNVFAAANYPVASQNALLNPTGKTAYASGSAPETIASAVTAAINNLGITVDQVPAFLDQIVKGGKEGEFEIEAMAKYFPELGALYSASGRSGLDASAELIALAQVVRKGAGMEAGAATNLQNLLSKMAAPETVKNFKDKGVDLRGVSKRAQAQGTPYILALLDEVQRLTGGDEFAIGELFGDMQAKSALRPLLNNRALYSNAFDAIRNKSTGVVDLDANFLDDTPASEAGRRAAAMGQTGRVAGSFWGKLKNPVLDEILGWFNPSYRRQEDSIENEKRLRGVNVEALELEIKELRGQIDSRPESRFGLPDTARLPLELRLKDLEWQLQQARKVQGIDVQAQPGVPSGPFPKPKPGWDGLDRFIPGKQSLKEAGGEAGSKFAEALSSEAAKAGAMADELKARFSFTATPTINPSFSGADPVSMRKGAERSFKSAPAAAQPAMNINNTFNQARDPERAAREAQRLQNRAIRSARARSLHDTGDLA